MSSSLEIRPTRPSDGLAIVALAVATGLLTPDEAAYTVEAATSETDGAVDSLVAVADSGSIVGATYCAREPVSDRVWNLYFIAVDSNRQSTGVGTALLQAVEDRLRSREEEPATALVIETSNVAAFERTREFYAGRGYVKVGQVPDYYETGDDKVIFWKSLT